MTLRDYEIFEAVCESMNMTVAAQKLYMSQPAVSQAIAEIENFYGVRLFERLSRKLYLTKAGERLFGFTRRILQTQADAEFEMRDLSQDSPLRVGASVTIAQGILPKAALKAKNLFPEIRLEVTEGNTKKLEELIVSDKLDIGLAEGEIMSDEIVALPFMSDELLLAVGKNHPFYGKTQVSCDEIAHENFILREEGSGTRDTFERAMKAAGARYRSAWTCTNTDAIKAAVREDLGITVLSGLALKEDIKSGAIWTLNIEGINFLREFKVIRHKDKFITRGIKNFTSLFVGEEFSAEFLKS